MIRFARPLVAPQALESALSEALDEIRSLPAPIPAFVERLVTAHSRPASEFFQWLEFDDERGMFARKPRRTLAAALLPQGTRSPVLAVFAHETSPPQLLRLRVGAGVNALAGAWERIAAQGWPHATEVALASEGTHGGLGWLILSRGAESRFWPAFPGRLGLREMRPLTAVELRRARQGLRSDDRHRPD